MKADMTEQGTVEPAHRDAGHLARRAHVNLRSEFDLTFYPWYEGAPENFDRFFPGGKLLGDFEIQRFVQRCYRFGGLYLVPPVSTGRSGG